MDYNEILRPFDKDRRLYMQFGKLFLPHEYNGGQYVLWTVDTVVEAKRPILAITRMCINEFGMDDNSMVRVYEGRIPTRRFFVSIMNNQEVPPPKGWETYNPEYK